MEQEFPKITQYSFTSGVSGYVDIPISDVSTPEIYQWKVVTPPQDDPWWTYRGAGSSKVLEAGGITFLETVKLILKKKEVRKK